MAKIQDKPTVKLEVTITLNESEIRALDGLTGYDMDEFLKLFYDHLGSHYLKPHEEGLRSLFGSVRAIVPEQIRKIDAARASFNKAS